MNQQHWYYLLRRIATHFCTEMALYANINHIAVQFWHILVQYSLCFIIFVEVLVQIHDRNYGMEGVFGGIYLHPLSILKIPHRRKRNTNQLIQKIKNKRKTNRKRKIKGEREGWVPPGNGPRPTKESTDPSTSSVSFYSAYKIWSKSNYTKFDQIYINKYEHLQY